MSKSYNSNYIKIYFWQGAAFLLRFLSMFIVTPYLTKVPTTFGIYSICISVTIFLGYADLGFLRAGQKYAAESFAKGDRIEEMQYIGFGTFVLFFFAMLCAFVFLYLGFRPDVLIKGLDSTEKVNTASNLLFILAAFTPVTVLQRMSSMIFEIRLHGYVSQRISLATSIITIGSVFYFFRNGHYQIINYFFFSQIMNLIAVLTSMWLAKKKYQYNLIQLFQCIHFNSTIYKKAKRLAYSGLYVMIVWILFYELDQLAIGKFMGANKVAIFAISFTLASFFRSIFGILFSPFAIRANHFVGNGDEEGLKRFCLQIFSFSAPLVIIPTVAMALVAKPFILSWVGSDYTESINLARFFSLVFTFSFVSYSASMILIAKVRIKEMYIIATIQPVIYWVGIICTYNSTGLLSFGIFKFVATLISEAYYFYILMKFLDISWKQLLKKTIYPISLPLLFLVISLLLTTIYLPSEKSKINLLLVLMTSGICIAFSFFIQYWTSSNIRKVSKGLLENILVKK